MPKRFLDITPSYPLKREMLWRVQVAESESGKEVRSTRWNFPKYQWTLYWRRADRTSEMEAIEDILLENKGGGSSFFFKEPRPSTMKDVYMGTGTGARTDWLLPVWEPGSFTLYVDSVEQTVTTDFTVSSYTGQHSHHLISFVAAPDVGEGIHCKFVDGYYTPLVCQIDNWGPTLVHPGWSTFECYLTLREPKEDMPES